MKRRLSVAAMALWALAVLMQLSGPTPVAKAKFDASFPHELTSPAVTEVNYGYDSVSSSATAATQTPTDASDVGSASTDGPRSSTSLISPTRAARVGPARFIVDSAGRTIDRASVATRVSAQRQGRHVVGAREYGGGSYFRSADDAQRVLDDFHSGTAEVLGVKGNDIVVRTRSVTGINHNPGAGYPHQPTNVFFIKGSKSPSVVPYNPRWGG